MADKDLYIAALEKKLAELSGIEVDQIKKNQLANASSEARAIREMAEYVEGIQVKQAGQATAGQLANASSEARAIREMAEYVEGIQVKQAGQATAGQVNPQVAAIYECIKSELGEERGTHALPPLQYDYSGLEPHICATIMQIHHTKHHQGYINNLKAATEKLVEAEKANDICAINSLLPAIKFNGGGHLNHTIFWTNMAPSAGGEPTGAISEAIKKDFGSFQSFKEKFSGSSVAVKGSGWGWLGYCPKDDKVAVATCQNQDPLQINHGLVPLLGLDVWEHAYYLQYKNLRADYVKAFFNVINWANVNQRYEAARKAAGH
ncbi:Superoxide dismutase [Mn], mitochondrial [Chionoecetes opilio]|uniref:superoxide dismutase n=1 Tax=Chionoecetes opilio TaxID=41210 RepID=A0A8J4YLW3_CHIOP|nr:Superoxide dismutase [Mn], mitochondrial [Chionoecetes opilio]